MVQKDGAHRPMPDAGAYALAAGEAVAVEAPLLDYAPPMPMDRSISIGLVGAGGISAAHLDAYRSYGLNVVAILDRHIERAEGRRDLYFPDAVATDAVEDVIGHPGVRVVDITTHAGDRAPLIERALLAGQHVLSQKPFVHDPEVGKSLVELAERQGRQLAVNQNGRWAPHLSYIREAVAAGLIGMVTAVHVSIQWDHGWIAGTRFEAMPHVILEDFGVHWFDFLVSLMGDRAEFVCATTSRAHDQALSPGLLSQVIVTYPGGQASLVFDANAKYGASDATTVVGTHGLLRSTGPDLGHQTVRLHTAEGVAQPHLEGHWFKEGFAGTMGALLCAIENGEPPIHAARGNLAALRLSMAAVESAKTMMPVRLAPSKAADRATWVPPA